MLKKLEELKALIETITTMPEYAKMDVVFQDELEDMSFSVDYEIAARKNEIGC